MEEFEVKGPEEEQVEHHATHGNNNFATRIAVLTAILAAIGAFYNDQGGKTLSEAMMLKNESAIAKTDASDQWGYYQAKSTKQAIMEGALLNATSDESKAELNKKIKKYEEEKEKIKEIADKLDEKSKKLSEESDHTMHLHHSWAEAIMIIQIAIALAAITILTKKRWLFWTASVVSSIGIILGLITFITM